MSGVRSALVCLALFVAATSLAAPTLVAGLPECTVRDVTVLARALAPFPLLPGIDQTCAAATAP